MKRINEWDGKIENTSIDYDYCQQNVDSEISSDFHISSAFQNNDSIDKTDYIVAASCGVLTGLLDIFWVGEFSLSSAQEWGRNNANRFVIKVAQLQGYKKSELEGAIRFLEKDAPIPSDQMTSVWGGGLQHHFRDFSHHASIGGLVFSVLSQFTGLSYGTNINGEFEMHVFPNRDLIGKNFEDKLFNGIVVWAIHLVSDMAGSSNNAGKGTGIPGPILSFVKEISALPKIREMTIEYKGKEIGISEMLSKLFNGTAIESVNSDEIVKFDLRTEMGIFAFGVKQKIPVVINQCLVRAFYFIKRLYIEISKKQIKGIKDISRLEPGNFLPRNNKCIVRMLTISSGVFCVVDTSDAAIRAFMKNPKSKSEFFTFFLLRTNIAGIGNFIVSIKNDIRMHLRSKKKELLSNNRLGLSDTREAFEKNRKEILAILSGDNRDDLSIEDISINISVEIDNTDIYDYAFHRMLKHIKRVKEDIEHVYNNITSTETEIFNLLEPETAMLNSVVSISYHSVLVETEKLMMQLFTLYGVDYTALSDDSIYKIYMPFYRIEKGIKTGYLFSRNLMKRIDKYDEILKKYNLERIKVVGLSEPKDAIETLNAVMDKEAGRPSGLVQYVPIRHLFELISNNEYVTFLSYVSRFNDEVNVLLGTTDIKESNKEENGNETILEAEKANDVLTFEILEEWLNRIIGGDVLLPKSSNIFFCIGCWGDRWRIEFSTVTGFDKLGFPENTKWPYIGDDLIWPENIEKEAIICKVTSLFEEYLKKGKYSGNLKEYNMISVGWFGQPCVIYKK